MPVQTYLQYDTFPFDLGEAIFALNPAWEGRPGPHVPDYRRWVFPRLYKSLKAGLAPATVLRGPRRVGKTVLLRQVMENLAAEGVAPRSVLYMPFDELSGLKRLKDPILEVARWFEKSVLGRSFNEARRDGQPAYLLFDEVQNLPNWSPQVKHLVDNHDVRVMITGSSSLRIEAGRDSLAGRITSIDLGPLLLREIAALRRDADLPAYWRDNGLESLVERDFWIGAARHGDREREPRRRAFAAFSERGAYPVAHGEVSAEWRELSAHLNETVIKRAIQHDLRMGPRGQKRDERLLEEVFRLCCRYAGQCPATRRMVREIQETLAANIGPARIGNYLNFLDGTMLVRMVQPLELRLKRKRSHPKICLSDHSLRASWLQEIVPLAPEGLAAEPHLSDLAGHLAESVLGYHLASIPGLGVAHLPERDGEPEVDFVLTVGVKRIPVEVKYRRRIHPNADSTGLRAFLDKKVNNAPLGILVTLEDEAKVEDPRVVPISLSSLLWMR